MLDVEKIKEDTAIEFRSMHLLDLASKDDRWGGFMFAQLDGAFNVIKNKEDWRAPIDVVVHKYAVDIVCASIEYFTATEPKKTLMLESGNYRITSEGYRMGPAGDH